MVYVQTAVEEMPFPSHSFDVVTSINAFDHVSDVALGMQEVYWVLCPKGQLVIIVEIQFCENLRATNRFITNLST